MKLKIALTTSAQANGTTYTVTPSGVKDLAGNAATGTGSFTTQFLMGRTSSHGFSLGT